MGIKRAIGTINVIAHVEIEAFAATNLVAKMEEGKMAPSLVYTDLKTLNYEIFRGKIDIISGGYPCQPFSSAGDQKGSSDTRHLWPHIRKAIDIIRPQICFFENVEGHITEGLYNVLQDLGELGYKSTWGIFSAEEVGAPHRRKRVFIMAHSDGRRKPQPTSIEREIGDGIVNSGQGMADANSGRCRQAYGEFNIQKGQPDISENGHRWPGRPGRQPYKWEYPRIIESELGGAAYGASSRIDRLRLLGNGVVPQTAELAFRTLMKEFE